jgi:PEGA domain
MRVPLAALLILLPTLAAAQSPRSSDAPATLPSIGLPLPEIGLPLPTIGLPQQRGDKPSKPSVRGNRKSPPPPDNRRGRGDRGGRSRSGVVVVPVYVPSSDPGAVGTYAGPGPAPTEEPAPVPEPPPPSTGTLWLDVQPDRNAQVYVDDYYVGTIEDVGRELTLEAGPHTVELRAAGYESLAVKVRIEAGRALAYRGALEPSASTPEGTKPAKPAAPAAAKKPIYFIPGCYFGNVPPKEAGLPAGCDPSKATTIRQ